MSPAPKKRGHGRKSNDVRGRDEEESCKFQGKAHSKNVGRGKCHEDISLKNDRDESEAQTSEISDELNTFTKKYSKRALNTNWDKYEEKTETSEELAGMDFQTALNCSSSAVSQLKLEEEKTWDEEFLKIDSNDFTSINCDNLIQALECIPFHDRMAISENFFMDNMVNEFNSDAEHQRKIYIPPKISRIVPKQTELENQSRQKESDVKNIIESLTNCLILKDEMKDDKNKKNMFVSENVDDDDDDTLEMLLSLTEEKHNSKKVTLPSTSESTSTNVQLENKPADKPLEKSDMSLNDWLDSIVED
ncbi:cell death regulator Aven-like [Centruroides sculpturatus]|uniref:cell death regulator Aven-like n=2 Tax=Centruroides sculpturatus TaxID=218467 RepID=UPI000C6DE6D8|nr:cell death regulator Aven-like [Centruroides sculpturatus]